MKTPDDMHPHKHFVLAVFFILAILIVTIVSHAAFNVHLLKTNGVEYF